MPRSTRPQSIEALAEAEFDDEVGQVIASLAAEAGPPPGMKRLSEAQKTRLWGRTDPKVDFEGFKQALLTTGIAQEVAQQMLVCQENPDLAEAYTTPTQDPGVAEALATFAEYPFRVGLLADLDPDEAVAEANRRDRAWQATLPPGQIEAPTAPTMPAPQQASGSAMASPAMPVPAMARQDVPPELPAAPMPAGQPPGQPAAPPMIGA